MADARSERIRRLVERAYELPPIERGAMLAVECAGDDALRREVESLLGDETTPPSMPDVPGTILVATSDESEKSRSSGPRRRANTDDFFGLVGTTLDGVYEIESLLGSGGMGAVYRARHRILRDEVAIKVLHADLAARAGLAARFLREGRAARSIRHPNVVGVHDMRTSEGGLTYLVMEYFEGRTLRSDLARAGRMSLDEALAILEPVAAALDAAHAVGIVHRDLKPENVMLRRDVGGITVKLLDLGVAKLREAQTDPNAEDEFLTVPGQLLGTPNYMSPEQWGAIPRDGGIDVDHRADVYALGVVAYELLAGRHPYRSRTSEDARRSHLKETPAPPPDAPPDEAEVWAAILRALAKDRADRFSSAGNFVAALRGRAVATPPPDVPAAAIPVHANGFFGRDDETRTIEQLFASGETRIVTLTGPGGVGKTRAAHEVAPRLAPLFPDGVALVSLATLDDASLVADAVAAAVGARESEGVTLEAAIMERIGSGRVLLVVDNFEHVVDAAATCGRLLAACAGLAMLVTSRTPLRLAGEREVALAPLAVPDTRATRAAAILESPATALFVDRARAAGATIADDPATARAIAEICTKLDGLPLAIELAAARARLMPPAAMLPRLARGLQFLVRGARDLPERQQTMRGAIAWSYELLDEDERVLFRQLAIFAGGFTVETAEDVCDPEGTGPLLVLDGIESLVDKSLLVRYDSRPDGVRFRMLATIREFALERLGESGERDALARRHAERFFALAEKGNAEMHGAGTEEWVARLEAERANLRAALEWSMANDVELALALAGKLTRFWANRAHYSEGIEWLQEAIARGEEVAPARRATSLVNLGALYIYKGELESARPHLERAAAIARSCGASQTEASAINNLASIALARGDVAAARAGYEAWYEIACEIGNDHMKANALNNLGELARLERDFETARDLYERALAIFRKIANVPGMVMCLINLGYTNDETGSDERAAANLRECLEIAPSVGSVHAIADALLGFASLAAKRGACERAALLVGASDGLRAKQGIALMHGERAIHERVAAAARDALGDESFVAHTSRGRALSLDDAIALARLLFE